MIISYYGKKLLKKVNEVENKNLTPKEFFIKVFYPLFFGNEKTLMFIQNSPFSNPSNKKNTKEEKLNTFFEKIKSGKIDSSMFVGGYADGLTSSTSFNLPTEYDHLIDENEIYYSWIGHALSFKFKGIDFLFDNEEILYDTYLGWNRYSELLSLPLYKDFKNNQISTWNMHWISNLYSNMPTIKFNPLAESKDKLESVSWVRFLFHVSKKHPGNLINAYAYKFDKTNETFGIVSIESKKIDGFLKFCQEYFTENNFLNQSILYEKILGTGYSMEKICEFGSIGITAMKPELLRMEEYHHKSLEIQKKIKKHYDDAIENKFNYHLYNLYIMAKLNLKDVQKDVIKIAESLYGFQHDTRKSSKTLVDDILATTSISVFLKKMGEALQVCDEQKLPQHAKVFKDFMNLALSDETKLSDLVSFVKFNYYCHKIENENDK